MIGEYPLKFLNHIMHVCFAKFQYLSRIFWASALYCHIFMCSKMCPWKIKVRNPYLRGREAQTE